MPRFLVYETAVERVTYKHVIEADSEAEARRIVEDERTSDQGEWVSTDTSERDVGKVEEVG